MKFYEKFLDKPVFQKGFNILTATKSKSRDYDSRSPFD